MASDDYGARLRALFEEARAADPRLVGCTVGEAPDGTTSLVWYTRDSRDGMARTRMGIMRIPRN